MQPKSENLIWIDLEMTGLNPMQDRIIEMAAIITDSNLNLIAESKSLVIFQPDSVLAQMDNWNQNQHRQSGLLERVKASVMTVEMAQEAMLDFINQHVPESEKSPMCGNSICQDRRFLARWMPKLESRFHYRNLDVSVLQELACRWNPNVLKGFKKKAKHLALEDVRESIEELRHYRAHFIKE